MRTIGQLYKYLQQFHKTGQIDRRRQCGARLWLETAPTRGVGSVRGLTFRIEECACPYLGGLWNFAYDLRLDDRILYNVHRDT
jgi:hypothetical protein